MVFVSVGLTSLTQLDLTEDEHKALLDAMKIICVFYMAQTQRNLMRMIDGDMVMHWKVMMEKKYAWSKYRSDIPYFLDYSAPLFSSCPRIDHALCPGLRVILRALE